MVLLWPGVFFSELLYHANLMLAMLFEGSNSQVPSAFAKPFSLPAYYFLLSFPVCLHLVCIVRVAPHCSSEQLLFLTLHQKQPNKQRPRRFLNPPNTWWCFIGYYYMMVITTYIFFVI